MKKMLKTEKSLPTCVWKSNAGLDPRREKARLLLLQDSLEHSDINESGTAEMSRMDSSQGFS